MHQQIVHSRIQPGSSKCGGEKSMRSALNMATATIYKKSALSLEVQKGKSVIAILAVKYCYLVYYSKIFEGKKRDQ